MGRGAGVVAAGEHRGEPLVVHLDRHRARLTQPFDERIGLARLLACSPRKVSGRPTTTRTGSSAAITARSLANPASVVARFDRRQRPRDRAGRVRDRDAGTRRAEVEREDFQLSMAATSWSRPSASASRRLSGFLPPASASVGLPAATAADDRAELADQRHGVDLR